MKKTFSLAKMAISRTPIESGNPETASSGDLLDLIRLRVAQIFGCDVGQAHYWSKLRDAGESSARLARLENWPVSLVFSRKERTALALAELLAEPIPDDVGLLPHLLHEAQGQLTRAELVRLVVAIEAMHEWSKGNENCHA